MSSFDQFSQVEATKVTSMERHGNIQKEKQPAGEIKTNTIIYTPKILAEFATILYSQAQGVIATGGILGCILGIIIGVFVAKFAGHESAIPMGILLGAVGIGIGISIANQEALKLKAQAQVMLCYMQIEENTRK